MRGSLVIFIGLAAGLSVVQWWNMDLGALQLAMRGSGAAAFLLTLIGSVLVRKHEAATASISTQPTFVTWAFCVALFLGAVVAVIQTMVVVSRGVFVTLDLMQGYPSTQTAWFGYGADGLWSLVFLCGACLVAAVSLRNRRLLTPLFWSGILLTVWAALLPPAYRELATGRFVRTGSTLLLLALWAIVPLGVYLLSLLLFGRQASSSASGHCSIESDEPNSDGSASAVAQGTPGFASSYAVVASAMALFMSYHLAVPIRLETGGFSASTLIVAASTGSLGITCFAVLRTSWSAALADGAMGLVTLAMCSFATLLVPADQTVLAIRFPMLFNAMIFGFACGSGMWAQVSFTCRCAGGDALFLGLPAVKLAPYARRASFVAAALALVCGATMALWPRFPGIAIMDDSLGRMVWGITANLFLLLVMLWSSRRLQSSAYHILTVITVLSTVAFVLERVRPFTSGVH